MPGGNAGREGKAAWEGLAGACSSDPGSDGSVFWGRRVGGVTCAELVGRGPGHLVRSPDGRRGGWGQGCAWDPGRGRRWGWGLGFYGVWANVGGYVPNGGARLSRLRRGWSLHCRAAGGGGGREGAAASPGPPSLGTRGGCLRAPPCSYPLVLHRCSPARPGPARGPRWLFWSPSCLGRCREPMARRALAAPPRPPSALHHWPQRAGATPTHCGRLGNVVRRWGLREQGHP